MAKKNRNTLKGFFETGKKPTEGQYANLIDSFVILGDENTGSLDIKGNTILDGHLTASGGITASGDLVMGGEISASGGISSSGIIQAQQFIGDGRLITNITSSQISITGVTASFTSGAPTGSLIVSGNLLHPSSSTNILMAIKTTGSIIPAYTSNYDLGSPTNFWKSLFVSNSFATTYTGIFKGAVSGSTLSSATQGTTVLTTNGVAGSTIDLGLQTTDSVTFNNITASGNISASGTIFANNFQSAGGDVGGISFTDELNLTGNLTSSGNISSSGNIIASQFHVGGDGVTPLVFLTHHVAGDNLQIVNGGLLVQNNITASANISASGNLSATGDLDIDGKSHFEGHITASGNISSSGNIIANSFTGIFNGALSSSAQIATEITGSFTAPSASISTRLVNLEAGSTSKTLYISGSIYSGSFSSQTEGTTGTELVALIITGSVIPEGTNKWSLGSKTNFFKDLYVGRESIRFVSSSGEVTPLNQEDVKDLREGKPVKQATAIGGTDRFLRTQAIYHETASNHYIKQTQVGLWDFTGPAGSIMRVNSDGDSNNVIDLGLVGATTTVHIPGTISASRGTATHIIGGTTRFGIDKVTINGIAGHITASGNISASGNLIGQQIYSDARVESNNRVGIYNTANDNFVANPTHPTTIHGTNITLDAPVTASIISSSGEFIGASAFITNITASGNISASSLMGGNITASNNISASGIITGLTGSFNNISTSTQVDGFVSAMGIGTPSNITSNVNIPSNINAFQFTNNTGDLTIPAGIDYTINTGATTSTPFLLDAVGGGAYMNGFLRINGNISSSGLIQATSASFGSLSILSFGNITSSGNISASGIIVGSNLSGSNTGDQSLVHLATTGSNVQFISITGSNISASGHLTAQHITSSGNVSASGTLTSNIVEIKGGALDIKNTGAQSYARFYCESANAHYSEIKAQPHALFSGNVTTLLPAYNFNFAAPYFIANITASGDISSSKKIIGLSGSFDRLDVKTLQVSGSNTFTNFGNFRNRFPTDNRAFEVSTDPTVAGGFREGLATLNTGSAPHLHFMLSGSGQAGVGLLNPQHTLHISTSSDTWNALYVEGKSQFIGNITSSGNISSSGTIIGLSGSFGHISASGTSHHLGNNVTLGNDCDDQITILGTVSASCDISSSGTISAVSMSGDGSGLTGVIAEWDGTLNGNAQITGSLILSGSGNTNLNILGGITASGGISASGTNNVLGNNVTLGDSCDDHIIIKGTITASCDISSSGTITALTGSFSNLNISTFSSITSSGGISGSGTNNVIGGNVTLGNDCDDQITILGTITASCDISSSGIITAVSMSGDGSGLTGVTAEWDGTLNGNAQITGSLILSGSGNTNLNILGGITASGGISGSGTNNVLGNNVTLGNDCDDQITILGTVSASCDISSSGTISAVTGSFGYISASGTSSFGMLIVTQNITASNVSASGNLIAGATTVGALTATTINTGQGATEVHLMNQNVLKASTVSFATIHATSNLISSGSTTLGNAVSDLINITGNITSSGNISASGTITAGTLSVATFSPSTINTGNITSSGTISASGLLSASNIHTVGNITLLGNISGSGTTSLTIGGNTVLSQITASGILSSSNNIIASQITASTFSGDGSGLTGVTTEWDGTLNGNAQITGSLILSGSGNTNLNVLGNITGSSISASGTVYAQDIVASNTITGIGFNNPTSVSTNTTVPPGYNSVFFVTNYNPSITIPAGIEYTISLGADVTLLNVTN